MSSFVNKKVPVGEGDLVDLPGWLTRQAAEYGLVWLLAHADDGVIWGRFDNGGLHSSSTAAPDISPPLRAITLQQCRLFGEGGELLLWPGDDGWCARLLTDAPADKDSFDEAQIVWGTEAQPLSGGFTLLREGSEERLHAVPLAADGKAAEERRIRLLIRHYLAYSDDGEARVAASRLLDLVVLKS